MKRLTGLDAMLLYSETPQIHTHTIKLGVFDVSGLRDGYTFESFRRVMAARMLGLAPMRYRLVDIPFKFHHPMWQENSPTEAYDHISRVVVAPPAADANSMISSGRLLLSSSLAIDLCGTCMSLKALPVTGSRSF